MPSMELILKYINTDVSAGTNCTNYPNNHPNINSSTISDFVLLQDKFGAGNMNYYITSSSANVLSRKLLLPFSFFIFTCIQM